MSAEKIERISKIGRKIKPDSLIKEPNKDYFEALMKQKGVKAEQTTAQQKETAQKTEATLFDQVRDLNKKNVSATHSSPRELAAQTDDIVAQIDTIKHKLETPDLEIKGPVQTILRNKLNDIDENLKITLNKAGSDYVPPEKTSFAKPIERFLGLLTHAQQQLGTIGEDVRTMAQSGNELSPANMLLIQLKVSYISQEVELFTSMLNKALESTKTLMNVQV